MRFTIYDSFHPALIRLPCIESVSNKNDKITFRRFFCYTFPKAEQAGIISNLLFTSYKYRFQIDIMRFHFLISTHIVNVHDFCYDYDNF